MLLGAKMLLQVGRISSDLRAETVYKCLFYSEENYLQKKSIFLLKICLYRFS